MEPLTEVASALSFRLEARGSSRVLCSTTHSAASLLRRHAGHAAEYGLALPALFAWGASLASHTMQRPATELAPLPQHPTAPWWRATPRESSTFSSSKRFPLALNAPPSEVQPLSYLIFHAEHPEGQQHSSSHLVGNSIRGRPLFKRRPQTQAGDSQAAGVFPKLDAADQSLFQSFRELDINRDGHIDRAELEVALLKMGLPASREYVAELMHQYDKDKDNQIDFEEFREYVRGHERHLKRAFRHFDADNSGSICSTELVSALQTAGAPVRESDVRRMMGLLSRGRSGQVSFPDFCRFACLLPQAQVSSGNHVLYAWANSAFWEDERDGCERAARAGPGGVRLSDHLSGSPNEPVYRLLIGGISGVLSRTIIAPIERLRTMMMLSAKDVGLRTAMHQMWQDGGFSGLFKGHMSTVIKVFPTSAIQFAVVHQTKQLIRQFKGRAAEDAGGSGGGGELNQFDCFLAGAVAGGLSCVISHPLDTIRTAMAVAIGSKVGTFGTARAILARSGLGGLYSGFGLSCMQEVLGNGLGFLAVDMGSELYRKHHDGLAPSAKDRAFIAAAGAAMVMTALMPLDVVVKNLQVQGFAGHPILYSGPVDAFVKIAQQQGVGAFYRGLTTTYLKTAPSMGCVYFFYDQLSRMLGVGGLTRYRQQSD